MRRDGWLLAVSLLLAIAAMVAVPLVLLAAGAEVLG